MLGGLQLILLLVPTQAAQTGEISIPLSDGKIVVMNAQLTPPSQTQAIPEFSFEVTNHTHEAWDAIRLRFDAQGTCGPERVAGAWSFEIDFAVKHSPDLPFSKRYSRLVRSLFAAMERLHDWGREGHAALRRK